MRARAAAWLKACTTEGLDVLVYCTLRSMQEQAELYAQGRSKPGRIVTYAKPGQSAHNYGLALDFCPLLAGKPVWSAASLLWKRPIALAEDAGLESASRWTRFIEYPHLQVPDWRSYIQPPAEVA